jgi:RNA polymerase sigma factor for flagellar operon FliA
MKTNVYEDIQKFGEQRVQISQHLATVRRIAIHLRPRVPAYIELDDMIQLGIIGLIEAEKSYDPSQGVSFEIFAKARIRGAIIDEARRLSDVSRLAIKNSKSHEDAIRNLSNSLGRLPAHREVADVLGLTIEAYENQRNHANQLNTVELESFADESSYDANHKHHDVFNDVAVENVKTVIADAIGTLDERRQLILKMYYVEEMNLKEIGAVIGVNESRVSQILSATLKELRPLLERPYRDGELA